MNKRQKKKRANWWRKDLYKWCRRHPCESKEIICRIGELLTSEEITECIAQGTEDAKKELADIG